MMTMTTTMAMMAMGWRTVCGGRVSVRRRFSAQPMQSHHLNRTSTNTLSNTHPHTVRMYIHRHTHTGNSAAKVEQICFLWKYVFEVFANCHFADALMRRCH